MCIVNYDASVVSKATFQQVQLGEECLDIGPICSQYWLRVQSNLTQLVASI